jgi:hypothetical protein
MRCEDPMKIIEIMRLTEQGTLKERLPKVSNAENQLLGKSRNVAEIVISNTLQQPL